MSKTKNQHHVSESVATVHEPIQGTTLPLTRHFIPTPISFSHCTKERLAVRWNLEERVANDLLDQAAGRVQEGPLTRSSVCESEGLVVAANEFDGMPLVVDDLAAKVLVSDLRSDCQVDGVEGTEGSDRAQHFEVADLAELSLRNQVVAVAESDFDVEIQRGSHEVRVANDGLDLARSVDDSPWAAVRVCESEVEVGVAENEDGDIVGVENLAATSVLDFEVELDGFEGAGRADGGEFLEDASDKACAGSELESLVLEADIDGVALAGSLRGGETAGGSHGGQEDD